MENRSRVEPNMGARTRAPAALKAQESPSADSMWAGKDSWDEKFRNIHVCEIIFFSITTSHLIDERRRRVKGAGEGPERCRSEGELSVPFAPREA